MSEAFVLASQSNFIFDPQPLMNQQANNKWEHLSYNLPVIRFYSKCRHPLRFVPKYVENLPHISIIFLN